MVYHMSSFPTESPEEGESGAMPATAAASFYAKSRGPFRSDSSQLPAPLPSQLPPSMLMPTSHGASHGDPAAHAHGLMLPHGHVPDAAAAAAAAARAHGGPHHLQSGAVGLHAGGTMHAAGALMMQQARPGGPGTQQGMQQVPPAGGGGGGGGMHALGQMQGTQPNGPLSRPLGVGAGVGPDIGQGLGGRMAVPLMSMSRSKLQHAPPPSSRQEMVLHL